MKLGTGYIVLGDEYISTIPLDVSKRKVECKLHKDDYMLWTQRRIRWALGYGESFSEIQKVHFRMFQIAALQRRPGATPEDDRYSVVLKWMDDEDVIELFLSLSQDTDLSALRENLSNNLRIAKQTEKE